jgi:hypothetical protein
MFRNDFVAGASKLYEPTTAYIDGVLIVAGTCR